MLRCTNSAGVTRGSDATLCFSTSPPSSVGSVVRRQRWDSLSAGHRPRWRPLAQRRGRPREVDLRCSQTCVRVSHGKMGQWHNGAPLHTHLTSSVVIWIRGEGAVIVVVVCTYVLCVAVLGQGISLASFTPRQETLCVGGPHRGRGEN